ncbi:MAG: alpha-ketoglutarate-dependent dioxygenase AlkB family protein [Saccharospirillum sp.]
MIEPETLLEEASGRLIVYRKWWPDCELWLQRLVDELPWQQSRIQVYGREHPIPRLEAWLGEAGVRYHYSGQTLQAPGWPAFIQPLVQAVQHQARVPFNAVLANWYRSGQDGMGWHADNEPELGPNPTVASLSFGARRDFRLRRNEHHKETLTVPLAAGDLLIMAGALQHHWQHALPKRAHAEDRVSLTFRRVL